MCWYRLDDILFAQLHQLLLVYRRHHTQCMRQMNIRWCVLRYCLETLLDAVLTLTTRLLVTQLKVGDLYNLHKTKCWYNSHISAESDYTALNDTFQLSSSALLQCVPIAITSDSVDEPGQECFTFTLSTTSSIDGLTLSPSEAEICISDAEG